jgi:hypothetical protein
VEETSSTAMRGHRKQEKEIVAVVGGCQGSRGNAVMSRASLALSITSRCGRPVRGSETCFFSRASCKAQFCLWRIVISCFVLLSFLPGLLVERASAFHLELAATHPFFLECEFVSVVFDRLFHPFWLRRDAPWRARPGLANVVTNGCGPRISHFRPCFCRFRRF